MHRYKHTDRQKDRQTYIDTHADRQPSTGNGYSYCYRNSKFYQTEGTITRTAGMLTQSVEDASY